MLLVRLLTLLLALLHSGLRERLLVLALLARVLALLGERGLLVRLLLRTGVRLLRLLRVLRLLAVLRELLLRRRTVAARLTCVRVLRRLGRGCGHGWILLLLVGTR
ncbi:hypothetical protein GCM10009804_22870 [Kribbella hippodromi]|uniref:Uncharacterized protein n=1 Tax=Kribbella hippodromi TaxID=434347 RepID=A0ABP4NSU6_9ACTN